MWIWLGGILILLLLIAALILLSTITLHLTLRKKNRDDTILLDVTMLYGFVRLHYQVPSVKLKNWREGLQFEKNRPENVLQKESSSVDQKVNKDQVQRWMDEFDRMLKATSGFRVWLRATLRRISFRQLEWSTNIGLQDAAHTATLTGALWGVKGTLVGWLSHHIRLKQRPKLFVVPVFGGTPLFSTEFRCIAQIRCGYAIYAGLVLIVRVLKVKGGVKKWLTILFKD
ncbi:MAG: DUF2953 domain-containing protein [Paenibacillaceae bacterium]|uniref:DUF2953 domain-containing protein n=1 Tax=Paenibacillus mellifer TaxID=2937794 RepID=A0A9X2BS28_9BACL|nr:DUF2953 domain-containing protein [Paenibacillus mellifer]MBW4839690.1 DUF2953 domain-containing protein [Paenibacillaceae bacterium]MCK8486291.1 DUF2953 domain-containing protein [Paenibacillus mellifer]